MAKRKNSAQRLFKILKDASSQNEKSSIADVWAHSFGLEKDKSTKRDLEVVENLNLAHGQFEITKQLVEGTDYSPELYQFAFNRIDRVLSVANLSSQWGSLKSHLAPDTLLAINWLSEVLPDEAVNLNKEFIEEIEKQLKELKKLISSREVPAGLKILVERHIEIIEKALRKNEIVGSRAIRDALYEGFSNSHDNSTVVAEHEGTEELSRLGKIWQTMKKAPGAVINTNRALEAGADLIEKGQKAIDFMDNFQI